MQFGINLENRINLGYRDTRVISLDKYSHENDISDGMSEERVVML